MYSLFSTAVFKVVQYMYFGSVCSFMKPTKSTVSKIGFFFPCMTNKHTPNILLAYAKSWVA